MRRVAVFVDAGYFWAEVCTHVLGPQGGRRTDVVLDYDKLHDVLLAEVDQQFPGSHLMRVIWYDGPGGNGAKTHEHRMIDLLNDFKLKLGTRNSQGAQKGVDGLIIADLISYTQMKAITDALLVTGDADITPGVVAAQGLGLRVHQLSIGSRASTSPYLAAEVDYKHTWGPDEIAKFAQAANATAAGGAQPATSATSTTTTPTAAPAPIAPAAPAAPAPTPAAPVPDTTAAPSAPAPDYAAMAAAAYGTLQRSRHRTLLAALTQANHIYPRPVDVQLLFYGQKAFGRDLTEAEKWSLRSEFKKLLPT